MRRDSDTECVISSQVSFVQSRLRHALQNETNTERVDGATVLELIPRENLNVTIHRHSCSDNSRL